MLSKFNHFYNLVTKSIPSKDSSLMTISSVFRNDFLQKFPDSNNLVVLELGGYLGYTTRFLSFHFKQVYSVEINSSYNLFSKILNSDRNNVKHLKFDLYNGNWHPLTEFCPQPDIVFIDASHLKNDVQMDIKNSLSYYPKSTLVFDDYGAWEGVNEAVNEFVNDKKITIISHVGYPQNQLLTPDGKFANHLGYEGVICEILN